MRGGLSEGICTTQSVLKHGRERGSGSEGLGREGRCSHDAVKGRRGWEGRVMWKSSGDDNTRIIHWRAKSDRYVAGASKT